MKSHVVDWGPKPFRFLDIWQEDKRFSGFVKEKWEKYVVKGNQVFGIRDKFKMLKGDLREWNKEVFSYIEMVRK